jgi:hypothetical protein
MKANELRIGNWLNHDGIFRQVSSLHSDNTLRFKDGESSIGCFKATRSAINPIPLTEEILLKCGFDKREDGDFNLFNASEVDVVINKDLGFWKCDGICFSVNALNYLHQLQNLYFALTNEELNIEL